MNKLSLFKRALQLILAGILVFVFVEGVVMRVQQ